MAEKVDRVVVEKSERRMYLMSGDEVFRQYRVSLGASPSGHKRREGDEKTPEGRYLLDWRNPDSKYYRSIRVSYPNENDVQQAKENGHPPGGNIFIHGLPNGKGLLARTFEGQDWTDGCIAVNDNLAMWEIWSLVKPGTPIEIRP
jgi:murein L,D-transpeptidase YafK